ncbi:MAG: hypothetical protein LBJ67_12370 [Planctomycetaceae bacterium]|jgi:hypothetical protein|nr:hypothetical protein [Planctomycetaceae bacterium]
MRKTFLTSGLLLAFATIFIGCGKKNAETPAGNQGSTSSGQTTSVQMRELFPQEKVVQQFINATAKRDREAAFALLTPTAQQAYSKEGFSLDQNFQGTQCRITGSQPITPGDDSHYGVFVTIFGNDNGETYQFDTVWGVRKNGNEYRIAGLMIKDEQAGEIMLDFENPKQSQETLQQAMTAEAAANANPQAAASIPPFQTPLQPNPQQQQPNPQQQPEQSSGPIAQPTTQPVR